MKRSASLPFCWQRRQRQLAILLGVAGVAIIVVVALILTSQSSASSVTAENVGDYSAFPQGIDEDGAPYIGEVDAPLTLTEYSDFACPHCSNFSTQVHRLIDTYVADGSLKIVYKPVSFVAQTSPTAAAAGLCAAEQGMFWEMHDALYGLLDTQGSGSATPGAIGQQDFNNDIYIPISAAQRRFGELQMIVRAGSMDPGLFSAVARIQHSERVL